MTLRTGQPPDRAAADPSDHLSSRRKRIQRWRGELPQRVDEIRVLTRSDLRARYGRGGWQLIKWVIDPFALVGVYLLLVTFIFYRRSHAVGLALACSIIPFQLLTMTVTNSLGAVQLRRSILANMRFARGLLPIATTLTETLGFAASLVLLALTMVIYGIAPTFAILWLPIVLAESVLLGVAAAYPATLIGVWAPDLRGLIASFLRAAYFLAPGLVTLAQIHGRTNTLVRLNPLTGLIEALRHAVLYRSSPPAWELLYPLGFAVVLLLIFVPVYVREQDHFAKVLE
jgi:ABC-type polysaccharide/polyol phosphate export permease